MVRFAFLLFLLVWIAVPGIASAQQPQADLHPETHATRQPVEVAAGMDLVAWQSLEHLRLQGASAVQAYRTFVLDYDASPLAVAAWSRLVGLGADLVEDPEGKGDDKVTKTLLAVRERWQSLQNAIASAPADEQVASIDLSEPEPGDDDALAALRDTGAN